MIRICKICGKEFDGYKTAHYCSDDCRYQGKRINEFTCNERKKNNEVLEKQCVLCGKTFYPSKNEVCCSMECKKIFKKRKLEKLHTTIQKSDISNVYWCKDRSKWCVELIYKQKTYRLGYFDDEHKAIELRDIAVENKNNDMFLQWYEDNFKNMVN